MTRNCTSFILWPVEFDLAFTVLIHMERCMPIKTLGMLISGHLSR